MNTNKELICFVNGIYSTRSIGGGDIYFINLVKDIPCDLIIFGGRATAQFLAFNFEGSYTQYFTDSNTGNLSDITTWDKIKLFFDHAKRCYNTIKMLGKSKQPFHVAYTMSDYWFDTIPLRFCYAKKKILYLGMIAPKPSLFNLASWHYWLSQKFSLWLHKDVSFITYSHPNMKKYLKDKGHTKIVYLPNSFDTELCDSIPPQPCKYDIVWTGRIHSQKGIKDLCYILRRVNLQIPNLKVLAIGAGGEELKRLCPKVNIDAVGIVSERRKFELLKSSKVFISTSHYESFGIAVGEAFISNIHVIVYDLPCYREIYKNGIEYVKCFDKDKFVDKITWKILMSQNYCYEYREEIKQELSWTKTRQKFYELCLNP